MKCEKDHYIIKEILDAVPIRQSEPGRHKCAGCAYEKGFEDGKKKKMVINLTMILNNLPSSQAEPQRHKDARIAYIKGYYDGLLQGE